MAKVAVIGAGFVGLSAAWRLAQAGHQVTVFEKESYLGGLAAGFKADGWDWYLDHHYHHVFASDKVIKTWARELGLAKSLVFRQPQTSIYYRGQVFPLDSPTSLLQAPVLRAVTKLRVAATLAGLKLTPEFGWRWLEQWSARDFLLQTMGQEAWQVLWQPLFEDKFAHYADGVNAAWFWARIKARTSSLGYFQGGFTQFALAVMNQLRQAGVKIYLDTSIKSLNMLNQQWLVKSANSDSHSLRRFDSVLVTTPTVGLLALAGSKLPASFRQRVSKLQHLAAVTLVIESTRSFFADETYWLNINDPNLPFLAVVEHTNFVSRRHYGNKYIVYVGKYLDSHNSLYQLDANSLLNQYRQGLELLSPGFTQHIQRVWRFQAPFAQPIVKRHHSAILPALTTPLPGLYWASMQHIYPWDRGTNFAVKLGFEVAEKINRFKV